MRKGLVAANWKMNGLSQSNDALLGAILSGLKDSGGLEGGQSRSIDLSACCLSAASQGKAGRQSDSVGRAKCPPGHIRSIYWRNFSGNA